MLKSGSKIEAGSNVPRHANPLSFILTGENMFSMTRFGAAAAALALSFTASAAQADTIVQWKGVAGVIVDLNVAAGIPVLKASAMRNANEVGQATMISTPGLTNDIDNVHGGSFPWTTQGGSAKINLRTGAVSFNVQALEINGTTFSGTPGPVTKVIGTLVCNASFTNPAPQIVDTLPVTLDSEGNATTPSNFALTATVPTPCANPLFVVRINTLDFGNGQPKVLTSDVAPWIATGTGRMITGN
jgi:hypothetical protein